MRQHSIDLMPASFRQRSEAGLRAGRFIAAIVAALIVLVMAATHSQVALMSAQEELFTVASEADQVFATEAREWELTSTLAKTRAFTTLYDQLALPLEVSAVLATVINELPSSMSLDQIDIDAGARPMTRAPRTKGAEPKDEAAPRLLIGEISGFAASDQEIAELVGRLSSKAPFKDVSLDFSRGRRVYERDAREFRLSFKIDLDAPYLVSESTGDRSPDPPPTLGGASDPRTTLGGLEVSNGQ